LFLNIFVSRIYTIILPFQEYFFSITGLCTVGEEMEKEEKLCSQPIPFTFACFIVNAFREKLAEEVQKLGS